MARVSGNSQGEAPREGERISSEHERQNRFGAKIEVGVSKSLAPPLSRLHVLLELFSSRAGRLGESRADDESEEKIFGLASGKMRVRIGIGIGIV